MSSAPIPWKHVRNVLILFAPLWVGAILLFGTIGVTYSLLSPDIYCARQPLVVRDEAGSTVDRLGRFASQTELKAAQETILEMAQNREVVAAALRQIGPPDDDSAPNWPSIRDIDETIKESVNILAPQGAEFGNTEVVYLQVQAEGPERSIAFCRAMFDNLTKHLRDVRRVRADSVIVELSHARDLARLNLASASDQMQAMESRFGADLAELRNLNDKFSGEGSNRRALEETQQQLQQAELELDKLESLHRLLVAGAEDPQNLLISGGDLLNSQPSLQRLKDGLIDAQLKSSQLSGIYTLENPKRKAAIATEQEIRERIILETQSVIASMQPMLQLQRAQVAKLTTKKDQLAHRLEALAEARVSYAKVDAELKQRTEQLAAAEQRLAEANASRSAAMATSLVSQLGPPQVSDRPVGPGTATMTFGSMMAGLIFGLGTVFLVAPAPIQAHGRRRWNDHLEGHNRRASDRIRLAEKQRRRASDALPSQNAPGSSDGAPIEAR
ncbi:hypothetical protein FYK55_13200 [Roseiconus nitratireducens]|uniref:Polysaccharide chain length determinant N-terminal domain-containing protein n=1 Tax=Roseiconus nitratireducens TaxID=2605748 RepID=A0A5M6D6R3_9BACT|nr:hypothetical protein [Roseiconus nitratireducens]KAA5543227.1 hypothetical protein FYK55_13200 [Roseiconus nitratireducens]